MLGNSDQQQQQQQDKGEDLRLPSVQAPESLPSHSSDGNGNSGASLGASQSQRDPSRKNDGTLSKSVVQDFRRQQLQVALVTFAVLTAAGSYVLMLFIAMPLSIHLIVNQEELGCDPEIQDDCFAPTDVSQKKLTLTLSLLRTMTFIMGSLVGVLSDRWGRRPLLIAALSGYACAGALFLIGWNTQTLGLFIFGGMCLGASSPVTPHGIAYVSDVSRPDRLATNMGILQGFGYFLGLLTGALISLAISQATRGADEDEFEHAIDPYNKLFNISYSVGLCFSGVVAVTMLFFLPESLHVDERTKIIDWKKANPFGFLALIRQSRYLSCLWFSAACAWMAVGAGESVTGGWWLRRYTQSEVNIFIMFIVMIWLSSAFGAAFMTPIFVKLMGLKGAIHFSMIMTMTVGLAFAFAPTVNTSYTAVGLSFLAAPVVPTELSLIMGQVSATQKGALAGALRSSEAFSKLIGIILFGSMFAIYIEPFRPDVSCVPLDYSSTNADNTCDCGVSTCPTYDATNASGRVFDASFPFYYEAAKCTLGQLSPMFAGKPSAHIPFNSPEPRPIVPQSFVDDGLVTRDDTCQGGGGLGNSITIELAREWCVSVSALEGRVGTAVATKYNEDFGCPGFDLSLFMADVPMYQNFQVCAADSNSADCDQDMYEELLTNSSAVNYDLAQFQAFAGIATNITEDVDEECASLGTAELNFCWEGVIAKFPGMFPFLYLTGLGGLSYLGFIIAEVFFRDEDREYWLHKAEPEKDKSEPEPVDNANEATVRPVNV
mmetsp:Transcript_21921/g.43091  ORF Transcript_21921/g.43091 Transcript_21921/m.43091 type:complete len:773 (-) Transcript_21921:197-2515(-)|eukprot:CAMPEP_0171509650 /NCGR_PEP_ID=MMETSP0958-20121227/14896_1 /TAXON_ID=87120 /ORGANISM="Aurantiochytrium limacinum, Strain ATCCMYA-1381" /LENGTH=772 /DNA_ID=CAMNT_0012046929 /DNA_START=188 /DNA_END=2506 /DNA_ORIENTATION=+